MFQRTILVFVIIFTQLSFIVRFVSTHLKDLGEKTKSDWTDLLLSIESKIVGGVPVSLEKYPFFVQFFNFGGMCGGTILNSKIILTAAHCFQYNTNTAEMRIFTNARYVFDHLAIAHDVWDYSLHENFQETSPFSYDIGLIIIHDRIAFGKNARAALISDSSSWMNEDAGYFYAMGFGQTQYQTSTSKQGLQEASLQYVERDRCSEMNKVNISSDVFCLHGSGERDTCQGDSGGGVVWNNTIVGIVSHGQGCAKTPSMYTNVFIYRSWIYNSNNILYRKYCKFHSNTKHQK